MYFWPKTRILGLFLAKNPDFRVISGQILGFLVYFWPNTGFFGVFLATAGVIGPQPVLLGHSRCYWATAGVTGPRWCYGLESSVVLRLRVLGGVTAQSPRWCFPENAILIKKCISVTLPLPVTGLSALLSKLSFLDY